jgi:intracellular sulfur oxidation DsrE/DsrF family protein
MKVTPLAVLILLLLPGFFGVAQEKSTGPVIRGYGEAWDIPEASYPTDTTKTFRVVFDVMNTPEDRTAVNPWMETAARFLNMHARSGIPPVRLKVALVVHNQASTDLLADPYYKERFGVPNPNAPLLRELMDFGAEVIFCGQSSRAREIPIAQTLPGVRISLSAMTALIQLQDAGYRLIKF